MCVRYARTCLFAGWHDYYLSIILSPEFCRALVCSIRSDRSTPRIAPSLTSDCAHHGSVLLTDDFVMRVLAGRVTCSLIIEPDCCAGVPRSWRLSS
jgi:hypothetical protein